MPDRRTAVIALLALLAVLALAVSAATLQSATRTDPGGGFGAGDADDRTGFGDDDRSGIDLGGPTANRTALRAAVCVPWLTRWWVQAVLLGVLGLFFAAMYRTTGSKLLSGMFVTSASFPFLVVYLALISCGADPPELGLGLGRPVANATGLGAGGGSAGLDAAGRAVSTPTALVGLLLVVAILGSLALLFVSTGDDEGDLADEPSEPPAPERRRAVGMAAGAAADRLEGTADLDNEVYRAWREMTTHLDVENPAASTPAEFAEAAVDTGMDPDDVAALTEVFEEVRYGGVPATPEREERAVSALRRIEDAYADGSEPGGGHSGGDER